jgi:putative membrane-bound dehydrogenase-like protein
LDRDYADELPRIKPTEPAAAMATFRVAAGFKIDQVATEPLVVDPIALSFDENGRLFVIEMRGYSEDEDLNLGRVRLLIDTNEDGQFDESHVYADGLSWPTALICYDGGVYVGVAPNILYLKDIDGDHVADQREVAFSGFGRSNVQGLLNSFRWGLDNRIHGATSSSAATVPLADGAESAADPLVLRGRDFAIEPRQGTIAPTSGGAQHGLSFNRWGEKFVCSNSDHIQHVVFEDRYVARNPYFAAPQARVSIAADGPQADVFRSSPIEPWRIVRTRLRVQKLVPGPVEGGGTPAGYFTGATGVTIFRGNAWPEEYLDWAIIGDVGSNLVHRKQLDSKGITYSAKRIDEASEFISSTDIWFRPAQFSNAPDGGLYITDMYREVIEHPKSLHPIIKQHLDLTSGRDRGRIYRVVSDGFQQPPVPKLGSATSGELVNTLEHPNGWHRDTAARLLFERQDRSVQVQLEQLATQSGAPEGRIRALYALDGMTLLRPEILVQALADDDAHVRQHAIRLGENLAREDAALREQLYRMVNDADIHVRYQLAFSLGQLSGVRRERALAQLARTDGGDGYFRIAIFSSLAEGAGAVLVDIARDPSFRQSKVGKQWLEALAAQIGKQQRADDVAALLGVLGEISSDGQAAIAAIVQGLQVPPSSALAKRVNAASGGQARQLRAQLISEARGTAADAVKPIDRRVEAIHLLRLSDFAPLRTTFEGLLEPHQSADVQEAAVATLATFDAPDVAGVLVDRWSRLSPRVRRRVADALFSRDVWIPPLLAAIEAGQIAVADIGSARLQILAAHPNANVRTLANSIVKSQSKSSRDSVMQQYREALDRPGDAIRGRAVFEKECAACHRVAGVGHEIGPNLAAMRSRGAETILSNVLDPNREVNPQYLNYALQTSDGRLLTGMIAGETATSVTLVRGEIARDTVLRIDIESLRSTGVSLMPEGLEKQVDVQSMADLLAYLAAVP